ncbi:conserved hypothetical protein [delta proteobacterium NaphS2]|nr:conserved hypothetical protein [delta proteobacterium NaphS2]
MEKILDVQEVLESMREDDQRLEKLIADLKKEEAPSTATRPECALPKAYTPPDSQNPHVPTLPD